MDPCGNDRIIYSVGTNDTFIYSIDDVFPIQMVYANESGMIMLQHISLSKIKSCLSSSGSNESHKNIPL